MAPPPRNCVPWPWRRRARRRPLQDSRQGVAVAEFVDTRAERARDRARAGRRGGCRHGGSELVDQPCRVGLAGRYEEDRELLADKAPNDVGAPGALREQGDEMGERMIAGRVPVLVVDGLEVIDVENR